MHKLVCVLTLVLLTGTATATELSRAHFLVASSNAKVTKANFKLSGSEFVKAKAEYDVKGVVVNILYRYRSERPYGVVLRENESGTNHTLDFVDGFEKWPSVGQEVILKITNGFISQWTPSQPTNDWRWDAVRGVWWKYVGTQPQHNYYSYPAQSCGPSG